MRVYNFGQELMIVAYRIGLDREGVWELIPAWVYGVSSKFPHSNTRHYAYTGACINVVLLYLR